ncbi:MULTISPECIES: hypothetical protein [unclassified Nocardiopsis]|uniref:hypothetical protein n=1 Tax=Nocardiopsis TaxID=2013 RepID=UPI00387B7560
MTVSSTAHRMGAAIDFADLDHERRYSRSGAYGRSKLANLLFAYELQRRLSAGGHDTASLAAHPGGSTTGLSRDFHPAVRLLFDGVFVPLLGQTPEDGALPTLRAATDPGAVGGTFYGPGGITGMRGAPKVVRSGARSYDREAQRRLWEVSEELTGVTYPV